MADYEIPDDLLEAQRAFYQADAEVLRVEATLPAASDIVAGVAAISDQQRAAVAAARAKRGRILDVLYAPHRWWGDVDNRYAARMALQKAAKG